MMVGSGRQVAAATALGQLCLSARHTAVRAEGLRAAASLLWKMVTQYPFPTVK